MLEIGLKSRAMAFLVGGMWGMRLIPLAARFSFEDCGISGRESGSAVATEERS